MSALTSHSRRALVATAALAAAPAVEAKNKKKKRKKKRKPPAPPPASPPPLATALMTVSNVTDIGVGEIVCNMAGAWKHLASGQGADFSFSTVVPMESTGDAMQAFLITSLQGAVSLELATINLDVPPERIAVTLI
jgi:hypothetical protein